jgi:hypothetical protein
LSGPSRDSSNVHFPAEAKLGQVRAFLKVILALGGRTQVAKVARELHADLVTLLPVMDAAEMLHLATIEKGEVKLLKAAEQLLATGNPDFSQVRPVLRGIEPFKTAHILEKFTAEQIADHLAKQGIRWHHEDTVNSSVVKEILIHWGIPTKVLDYDGYTATFTAKPTVK